MKELKIKLSTLILLIIFAILISYIVFYFTYININGTKNSINASTNINSNKTSTNINNTNNSNSTITKENLDYSIIKYSSKKDISFLKKLKHENNYYIINSYSDYMNLYKTMDEDLDYTFETLEGIETNYFNSNNLIVVDDFAKNASVYSADIKNIDNNDSSLNIELCVDYIDNSDTSQGLGNLFFIKLNGKDIKNINLNVDYYHPEIYNIETHDENGIAVDKPVIYLYPTEDTDITVKLSNPENLTCVYPNYNNEWTVHAKKDGTLIDKITGRQYYCLYYEALNNKNYSNNNLNEGFVINSSEITKFLEEKLKTLGLNDKESEEFIIYWLPKLQNHKYIFIRFQSIEEINQNMSLSFSQKPDSLIRVMMEWKGLKEKINVKEQILTPATRKGFTVVEWGGTEIK